MINELGMFFGEKVGWSKKCWTRWLSWSVKEILSGIVKEKYNFIFHLKRLPILVRKHHGKVSAEK